MKTVRDEARSLIIELVANSCFEDKEDIESFIAHPPIAVKSSARGIRHDEKGYGDEVVGLLSSTLEWALEVVKAVPDTIAQDAIKFWIYHELYKRIKDAPASIATSKPVEKIKNYLEKQNK